MCHFGLIIKCKLFVPQNNSYLAGHASHSVKYVEHSTGTGAWIGGSGGLCNWIKKQ